MTRDAFASLFLLSIVTFVAFCDAVSVTSLRLTYLEEESRGAEIYNLKKNLPQDVQSRVYFELKHQEMKSGSEVLDSKTIWVRLNRMTGVLSVNTPVDREEDCGVDSTQDCVIVVKVVRQPESDLQIINIELDVADKNDNPPVFPVDPIVVNVSESAHLNKRIPLDQFMATDRDIGQNARVTYKMQRNTFFGLNEYEDDTGARRLELVVADELDHERSDTEELTIRATDDGTPIKSTSALLRVNIIDANDNAPVFNTPVVTVDLRENLPVGEIITTVEAHDRDSNEFGQVRYFIPKRGNSLEARKLVRVDPETGRVYLNRHLNYAKHDKIRIIIGARDQGGDNSKVGNKFLEIRVVDVNDNSPVIQTMIIGASKDNTAYLKETEDTGIIVAQITATDGDSGMNGQVVTTITTRTLEYPSTRNAGDVTNSDDVTPILGAAVEGFFELEDGFISTLRQLDRESIPGFVVDVRSCDRGTISRCSFQNLTIFLLDENDNSPVFDHVAPLRLSESTEIGTSVAVVTATDRDALYQPAYRLVKDNVIVPSSYGVIRYRLEGGKGCFNIDEQSGTLKLAGKLDYETKKKWELVVTARDMGNPPQSTRTNLRVDVINVNDNKPIFTNPSVSNSSVYATIKSEEIITTLEAMDRDGEKIRYSISLENGKKTRAGGKFIVDPKTGALRLNFSNPHLDTMLGDHYITLKAQDSGVPPSAGFTILNVKVTDLPLHQIISMQKRLNEDVATGDLSVVLIASLAAATVLLIIVLTGVAVRCKRENKEIRTYNCRSAETRKGWKLSASQGTLTNDVGVASTAKMMSSRDSNLNSVGWSQNGDKRLYSDVNDPLVKCQISHSSSNVSQRTIERKMTSFSKPNLRSDSLHQVAQQVDGDSGRGDSDHDTGSYEDKESMQAVEQHPKPVVVHYHNEPCDVAIMEMNDSSNLGPHCTQSCLDIGHSDKCWLPVYDAPATSGDYVDPRRANTPSYAYQQIISSSPMTPCGLETIRETQPLHSVLSNQTDEQIEESYLTEPSYSSNPYYSDSMYAHSYTMPYQHRMDSRSLPHGHTYESAASYVPTQSYVERQHSASDLFHDGHNTVAQTQQQQQPEYYPTYAPLNRCTSPSAKSDITKRRSTASLHGELLHRRFLAVAQGSSRADDLHTRSMTPTQYGQVTMQETQQIIDDIDQLIDT
uniref:Putative protocadherin beta-18 n=1 Tax=Phallusia mammillata TaxID=59560 RepID=A0A6F9DNY9_9ASCI|nr:putative protocadherin beta-18 [Phallusia mammillata]